jgi:hypothetical protein
VVRYIVRSTPTSQPLAKATGVVPVGNTFTVGGRTWRLVNHGRFAVISTDTDTLPFSAIVIPPAQAVQQAIEIGRDLDAGLAPKIGTFGRSGRLPTVGGGVPVAA